MKSRFRNPPLLILSAELRGPCSPPWPWPPHFGRGSNKRSLRSIGSWTLSTCWNSVIMSRRLFSKAQIGSKSMVLKPLNWLKQRLNGRWINEEMWWNVVNPNKTSGIRPAKLRCNGLHHVFDGDMSGKFMECFRYGHLTNFINKKMWSRWDLLTEMVGCYHHLNGGLSLTWSENFPTGTTDGTGPVGTSEKSLGFSFCRFHVKKNWMKPTTIDFWSEISHVDAPLWKSPDWSSNHITSSPTNHRNSRRGSSPIDASIPGRFTHIPWWFFVVATMARPMAHLLLAMCSTSLGVVAISQVWVDL